MLAWQRSMCRYDVGMQRCVVLALQDLLRSRALSQQTRWERLQHVRVRRSQEGIKQSMALKDAMREHCVADVAEAWYVTSLPPLRPLSF